MTHASRPRHLAVDVETLAVEVRAGQRSAIGRALTLVESRHARDQAPAEALLAALSTPASRSHRVGLSGLPGAGKSTLIEALGTRLLARGRRIAVLAVDPSSQVTGGSILGDKTRMTELAHDPRAFVRPSPTGGALGGVARSTRESIRVLEAAGFDLILVETVGVGQSEADVASMVDTFVLILVPGTGDELQGIKRGALELADLVVINKAEGEGRAAAEVARRDFAVALHLAHPRSQGWRARVLPVSAHSGDGLEALWDAIEDHYRWLQSWDGLEVHRGQQRLDGMWRLLQERLLERARSDPRVAHCLEQVQEEVRSGALTPRAAADRLLDSLLR